MAEVEAALALGINDRWQQGEIDGDGLVLGSSTAGHCWRRGDGCAAAVGLSNAGAIEEHGLGGGLRSWNVVSCEQSCNW
jgi:hypothetical protein